MKQIIKQKIGQLVPEMVKIRHYIHANPELAGEEFNTSNTVINVLKDFGYTVQSGIAGYGMAATLDSGKAGKTVAIRAELDALPVQEETNIPYKSEIDGKMHACGHDGHIATLLTIAGALIQCKEHFSGKIKFIFQPAEETAGSGAIDMVNHGILENPTVDAIFGFHGTHRYEVNKFATNVGCLMAGHDTFIIKLNGISGYVSSIYAKSNPIDIGAQILQEFKLLQDKISSSREHIIISATQFHAGDTHNVVPSEVFIKGSIRTIKVHTQTQIRQQIYDSVMKIIKPFVNIQATVDFQDSQPSLTNTSYETGIILKSMRQVLDQNNIIDTMDTIMAPEGFASYLEKIPGSFFFVGNGLQNGCIHKETYDFNDEIIPVVAEVLSLAIVNYLNNDVV